MVYIACIACNFLGPYNLSYCSRCIEQYCTGVITQCHVQCASCAKWLGVLHLKQKILVLVLYIGIKESGRSLKQCIKVIGYRKWLKQLIKILEMGVFTLPDTVSNTVIIWYLALTLKFPYHPND